MEGMLDRRGFISCATAVGVAAGTSLVYSVAMADEAPTDSQEQEPSASELLQADVVVVGAGISGLAATVQAAELGLKVITLEVNDFTGGNGLGTEGIFAIGSKGQEEQGIELTLADIVASEQDFFKYKVDALFWKDMVEQSADTITWLEDNGVEFSGLIDDYPPLGSVKTMHWWKDGLGSSYVDPMGAKAEELGVQILMQTRGQELLLEEGKVVGIIAADASGNRIQIDTPVVILATGGFADNGEKLHEAAGVDPDKVFVRSFGGHMGDGLAMAVQAGARDYSLTASYLRETTIRGVDFATPFSMFFFTTGSNLWVNENGERFADENCLSITSGCQSNANTNQKQTYAVFSQAILDANPDASTACADLISAGTDEVATADSIEELADVFGIPADTLAKTLERYNGFCDAGIDEDYAKDPSQLVRLDPPYYLAKMSYCYMSSIGGIKTSRHAEVLDAGGTPVPGLYAVGSDGCQLYAGTYTISVCSSYNGNNVYSGRNAARNAQSYIQGL